MSFEGPHVLRGQDSGRRTKAVRSCTLEVPSGDREAFITTARIKIKVDLNTGRLSFFDRNGLLVAVEAKNGRTLTPAEVQGDKTFHVRQEWQANADEALYGLGQHQLGLMNIKGFDLDL